MTQTLMTTLMLSHFLRLSMKTLQGWSLSRPTASKIPTLASAMALWSSGSTMPPLQSVPLSGIPSVQTVT